VQPDAKTLDELVKCIVDAVHPLRIILFGSAARGEMRPSSDLDVHPLEGVFLVVMPDGTRERDAMGDLYVYTANMNVPVDILVATPSMLAKYRHKAGLIYRTVLREGKELYVAANACAG